MYRSGLFAHKIIVTAASCVVLVYIYKSFIQFSDSLLVGLVAVVKVSDGWSQWLSGELFFFVLIIF